MVRQWPGLAVSSLVLKVSLERYRREKRPGMRSSQRRRRGEQEGQEWRESADGANRVRGLDQVERTDEYMVGMAMASSWKPSLERIRARRKAWCGLWGGEASDPVVGDGEAVPSEGKEVDRATKKEEGMVSHRFPFSLAVDEDGEGSCEGEVDHRWQESRGGRGGEGVQR